ncbi:MAG: hypothetical protein Q4D41_07175 [Prevotellaceae bacterium]|nr:hypothetical protein [Prevotellaceae bacterium]
MKRFLLFAAVAIAATSVSAQKLSTKADLRSAKSNIMTPVLSEKKIQKAPVAMTKVAAPVKQNSKLLSKKLEMPAAFGSSIVRPSMKKAPSKVGTVQAEYTGTGTDYSEGTATSWTMYSGTDSSTGTLLFADVIPNIAVGTVDYIYATYTQSGSTITIPAQSAGLSMTGTDGTTYYIYLLSGDTEDGSITLTLGEDGSLDAGGQDILYGAFSTDAVDFNNYGGYVEYISNVKYLLPGQATAPSAEAEPDGLYLHAGYSNSGYGYQNNLVMMPAYNSVSFVNRTSDPYTSTEWSVSRYDNTTGDVAETITGTDTDFTFNTIGGYTYGPVTLTASYEDQAGSYTWGTANGNYSAVYAYAGQTYTSFEFTDGTYAMVSKANMDNSIAYYSFLGTPDVNSQSYSLSDLILYQGKPTAPLYIEGVNYFVRNFVDNGINLTCQIVKATRTADGRLTLGDVIAESTTVSYATDWVTELQFTDFYVYDEDGMTQGIEHLFIEDEFAVVFSGWDNGTFSAAPYGEYDYNENGVTSTFIKMTGDTESVYRFGSLYSHQCVGFTGVVYGYLYSETGSDFQFDAAGGTQTITIEPMLCASDEDNNYTTALYVTDDSEIPDWISAEVTRESYTSDDWSFDLSITASALPDGVTGRSGSFVVYQWGAKMTITVSQGDATGITNVTVTKEKATDGKTYNLAGQRVSDDTKGIVIRDGKKFINK